VEAKKEERRVYVKSVGIKYSIFYLEIKEERHFMDICYPIYRNKMSSKHFNLGA
jgi:hypothetical protein